MGAIDAMLLKKSVIYQGREYLITNTYSDGTADLTDGVVNYPDVKLSELKMAKTSCHGGY